MSMKFQEILMEKGIFDIDLY